MPKYTSSKWLVIGLALLVPLAFSLYTNHVWEDYYITFRSSRNLVDGNGLVFTPGERLHTFTSPLGVLVPALCYWIGGEDAAIWIFRAINVVLLAVAASLAWDRLVRLGVGALGRTLFFGLVIADCKLADFATDGMETAILVYFVVLLWGELEREEGARVSVIALSCAGLEWTRPDAFVLGAALILPHLLFGRKQGSQPRLPLRRLVMAGALAVALYLPWLLWAWWYYGTPVPHTIIAKSQLTPPVHLGALLTTPWRTLLGQNLLVDLFMPAYWFYTEWPSALVRSAQVLTVIASFAWLVPKLPAPARRISFTVFLGGFYICSIILFPWYSPPWMVLAALAVGLVADSVATYGQRTGRTWTLLAPLRIGAGIAIGLQVLMLIASSWEMRVQQRLIEYQVRKDIGVWLHDHAGRKDTVFLEPLGYIGYYSGLKMYDVPGLSSPEVVAVMRSGHMRLTEIITQLHPTWLVMRPFEVADSKLPQNAFLRNYELVRTWDVLKQVQDIAWLPNRKWLEHDAVFRVYHLRLPQDSAPHAPASP